MGRGVGDGNVDVAMTGFLVFAAGRDRKNWVGRLQSGVFTFARIRKGAFEPRLAPSST